MIVICVSTTSPLTPSMAAGMGGPDGRQEGSIAGAAGAPDDDGAAGA